MTAAELSVAGDTAAGGSVEVDIAPDGHVKGRQRSWVEKSDEVNDESLRLR